MTQSLYELRDGLYLPTRVATSAWSADVQSGIVVAGLLTHVIEQEPGEGSMILTRLTLDILRPVPMSPLTVTCKVIREGRRMQTLEAVAHSAGTLVARMTGMRLRTVETPDVGYETRDDVRFDSAPAVSLGRKDGRPSALETRVVCGGRAQPGPGILWGRPAYDLLPGVRLSPVAAAAMLGDTGSGVSNVLDPDAWNYSNVDLTIHFARQPRSDWILVDARTVSLGNGVGLVDTILADIDGQFGRACQTLFVTPRTVAA